MKSCIESERLYGQQGGRAKSPQTVPSTVEDRFWPDNAAGRIKSRLNAGSF
jgi:hypothetical protein